MDFKKNYISASSAARLEMSKARRASPEAADTLRAINSTASGSKDTKFSNLKKIKIYFK